MDKDRHKTFLDLYAANQQRIYGYIVTLMPNRSDAEEVFAQTTLVLWEKWSQFDPTRNFVSWASGVAHYEILKYRAKPERRWEGLTEQAIAAVSAERDKSQHILDQRSKALLRCIEQLKEWQRRLLETCYSSATSIAAIAQQMGKTPNAVSLRMRRIRQVLHDCVDRNMQQEEPRP
jgi:RNA polymerase sigma-70 factor, ECF subfamily